MINCIIYEDNEKMQNIYKHVVKDFFKSLDQDVCFYVYSQYCNNLENEVLNIDGEKVFILDIEVPGKSGLDLARIIRNSGDWTSPLIVVTSYDYLKNTGFTSKMLMLDFISKKEDVANRLLESLKIANNIMDGENSYTFQYNGELYHVEYLDILYFEKDLNDNYTFLYTKKETYKIKESIIQIEAYLEDNEHFYKVHRSCIVNIDNIDCFDLRSSTLYLGEHSTDLVSKEGKEFLRKYLKSHQIRK